MAYKIKATFAPGVTQDQLYQVIQDMGYGPDKPAPGNTSHEDHLENGCVVFVEEWESKAVFDIFVNQRANPALKNAGIPLPDVEEL